MADASWLSPQKEMKNGERSNATVFILNYFLGKINPPNRTEASLRQALQSN